MNVTYGVTATIKWLNTRY